MNRDEMKARIENLEAAIRKVEDVLTDPCGTVEGTVFRVADAIGMDRKRLANERMRRMS